MNEEVIEQANYKLLNQSSETIQAKEPQDTLTSSDVVSIRYHYSSCTLLNLYRMNMLNQG